MPKRERVIWKGQICTVLDKSARKVKLRTPFGFVWDDIPKKEVEELRDDDERKVFTFETTA